MTVVCDASVLINLARIGDLELLLIDERLGRETARHLGLQYVGLIGVLVAAKRSGFIEAVKSRLDVLRDAAGFRVSDALYQRVLHDQEET